MLVKALCTFTQDSRGFQVRQAGDTACQLAMQWGTESKNYKNPALATWTNRREGGDEGLESQFCYSSLPRGSISPMCKQSRVKLQFLRDVVRIDETKRRDAIHF